MKISPRRRYCHRKHKRQNLEPCHYLPLHVQISHHLETHLDPCKKGVLNPVRYQAPLSFNSQQQRQQTIEFGSSAPDFFSQTRFSYSLMQTDFIFLSWDGKTKNTSICKPTN
jgi:hypothetical protein